MSAARFYLLLLCCMSVITLFVMGSDKRRAIRGARRVPEARLFLLALLDWESPPPKVTVVLAGQEKKFTVPPDAVARLLSGPTKEFPLKDGKTTFYVCRNQRCLPPVNDLNEVL